MSDHASSEQLSALLDGELSLVAREAVSDHLRGCPTCAALHDQLVEIAATLAAVPAENWSQEMTTTVLERTHARGLEAATETAGGRDWSLAIAAALAVAGLSGIAFVAPFAAASAADGLRLNIFAALAEGAGLTVDGFLTVLVLLPMLALLAVPLLRQR